MGIDTFLILPTGTPAAADRLLREHPDLDDDATQRGVDFVALYQGESFNEVSRAPALWGSNYARLLPAWLRRKLDRRGILALPEVGQSFAGERYRELASDRAAVWLPVSRKARAPPRERRILLVHVSAKREARLKDRPQLVRQIVDRRRERPVPNSFELGESWIELQRLLFDFQWQTGSADARAEALGVRTGLPLYEDSTIELARLVPAEEARRVAGWVVGLPADAVGRVRERGEPSPASLAFPASLGASEADDLEAMQAAGPGRTETHRPHARTRSGRAADNAVLDAALQRLKQFYAHVAKESCAVLVIRFRA